MLVEDEYLLNQTITDYLKNKGYEIDNYTDGLKAIEAIKNNHVMYVLDIDIPEIDGITLLESIRKIYPQKPIIMISATIELDMISKAYNTGCSDYLKKPFDILELELKIKSFLRTYGQGIELPAGLFYDTTHQQLFLDKQELILTFKERVCFELLAINRGHLITHEQIEMAVWGGEIEGSYVRQLVKRLRDKIPSDIIENRIGEGYIIT